MSLLDYLLDLCRSTRLCSFSNENVSHKSTGFVKVTKNAFVYYSILYLCNQIRENLQPDEWNSDCLFEYLSLCPCDITQQLSMWAFLCFLICLYHIALPESSNPMTRLKVVILKYLSTNMWWLSKEQQHRCYFVVLQKIIIMIFVYFILHLLDIAWSDVKNLIE